MSESTPPGFCDFFGCGDGVKNLWQTGPSPESPFVFGSSRSRHGLYKYHFSSTNNAEFRLHRWLPEFEQDYGFQIWKKIRTQIQTFWNRSVVGVWKCHSGHLWLRHNGNYFRSINCPPCSLATPWLWQSEKQQVTPFLKQEINVGSFVCGIQEITLVESPIKTLCFWWLTQLRTLE